MGQRISGLVGFVARFKPLHLGQTSILDEVCSLADHLSIGIGSANEYDYRNPFTAEESREMLMAYLGIRYDNFSICLVPDLHHGPRWRELIRNQFGELDYFITANDYVRALLEDVYVVVHPLEVIPVSGRTPVTGTMVRTAMAQGISWEEMVPDEVATYIKEKHLDQRFFKEFGLRTLADLAFPGPNDRSFSSPQEQ